METPYTGAHSRLAGQVEAASEGHKRQTHTDGRQAFRVLGPGRATERHRELMGSPGTERAVDSRGPTIKVLIPPGLL